MWLRSFSYPSFGEVRAEVFFLVEGRGGRDGNLHLVVFQTRDTLARDSGEGCSGEERWVLNRLGGMAIVRVRSRRKEHGRTDGSSVLYTLQDTYCVRSTRCWFVETMRVSAPEHYWRAVEKDDTAANPC